MRTVGDCPELNSLFKKERVRIAEMAETDSLQGDFLHPVFAAGNPDAKTVLIGEAPGREESERGIPFVGKAGRQLDELFGIAGIERSGIYLTNVVKYRPVVRGPRSVRNRTPSMKEIRMALPLLERELKLISPEVIVTLGKTPLTAVSILFGIAAGNTLGEVHGRGIRLMHNGSALYLFPLYHPASGIYNRELISVMAEDAGKLGQFLN